MRKISHFSSKGARVTVCFDFLFCLEFYLLKREEKKRRKKKEEKERRKEEKVPRILRLGNYPNFSFFVLLFFDGFKLISIVIWFVVLK